MRIVVDTNVVVSALMFTHGHLGWLRSAWQTGLVKPLVSRPVVDELIRVLKYPRFRLQPDEREELLGQYLPWCDVLAVSRTHPGLPKCRDPEDDKFLQLAVAGSADFLVTGDSDLLSMPAMERIAVIAPKDLHDRLTRKVQERIGRYRIARNTRAGWNGDLGRPRGKEIL